MTKCKLLIAACFFVAMTVTVGAQELSPAQRSAIHSENAMRVATEALNVRDAIVNFQAQCQEVAKQSNTIIEAVRVVCAETGEESSAAINALCALLILPPSE